MSYTLLPEFTVDSDEWHEARRSSLGASEVAAVLGLSKWQTPLSVYMAKQGVRNEIPENLAYFGRNMEPVIAGWIMHTRPDLGIVGPGFSARSDDWPWLAVSPDRIVSDNGKPIPVELKTSSAYSRADWESGVPLYYLAQVQAQIAVLDAPYGWLAVLHGGNDAELFRIERDEEFITQHLIPKTREFWEDYVTAGVPPEPSTIAEQALAWPTDPGSSVELPEAAWEAFERRTVLLSDARAMTAEADALAKVIGDYAQTAETLTYQGEPVATLKTQAGRRTVAVADVEKVAPELIKQGAPFKVLRAVKTKDTK